MNQQRGPQKRIFVPTRSLEDWRQLLADPEKHWVPNRSAMSLARRWEEAAGIPEEIRDLLQTRPEIDCTEPELVAAFPELCTALPGGSTMSQTDLFAIVRAGSDLIALGVEGKAGESFGPTLAEWGVGSSPGKRVRLDYLTNLLGLPAELPGDVRYQLLHRTAAAVIEARRFGIRQAAMVVHSFAPLGPSFTDFQKWCRLFEQEAEPGRLIKLAEIQELILLTGWASPRVP